MPLMSFVGFCNSNKISRASSEAPSGCGLLSANGLAIGLAAALVSGVAGSMEALAKTPEESSQLLEVPMHFEPNQGQTDASVDFVSRGPGYTIFLSPTEAVLSLRTKPIKRPDKKSDEHRPMETHLRMALVDANKHPQGQGLEQLPGTANYFIGRNPDQWRSGVPTFAKVKYAEVYAGVDLVYYGNQRQLEYDFIVQPFADAKKIAFKISGADRVEIDQEGNLNLHSASGKVCWRRPFAYQDTANGRQEVPARFVLKHRSQVAFEVGAYDRSKPLVIDPILYATYLGGSGADFAVGMAVDAGGNVYVIGDTASLNFPTRNAYRTTSAGSNDLFVTKLNSSGNALVYSTYIGGSGDEFAGGIAVDAAGQAFVTGYTESPNYPTRNPAYNVNSGFFDVFLTKLGVNGSNLVYSTYLGGNGDDFGVAVAIDNGGAAYLTGRTYSRGTGNGPFPTTQGAYQGNNGNGNVIGADAFVTKFDTNGAVSYSTFLGGNSEERGNGIAVDGTGNAYIVGEVSSFPTFPTPPSSDFPVVNAFQPQFNQGSTDPLAGTSDAFLTKLNAAGSALIFSTFLGGFDNDSATGVVLDPNGRICIVGSTSSTNFPVLNAAQPMNAGAEIDPDFPGPDAFVTQFQTSGTALSYSTFLGGTIDEFPFLIDRFGIAVDRFGNLYVAGQTGSLDFPVTPGADQTNSTAAVDAFVAKINPAVSGPASLVYATLLSGNSGVLPGGADNEAGAIGVDTNGNFYVAGITSATNFPVTGGSFRTTNSGGFSDAFVVKFLSPRDLSVTMFVSSNPTAIGSNVTYTIRVNNNSPNSFNNVTNTVQFPTNVQFVSITNTFGAQGVVNAGRVTFNIGVMTNNASAMQTIVLNHLTPGTFTNTATVTSTETPTPLEPNKSNNVAIVEARVRGVADVTLAQSVSANPVLVSSNLIYTIGITNKGPSPATSIVLTDSLPANLVFISASSTAPGACGTNENGVVVCDIGTLTNGAGARVTLTVLAATSGTISHTPVVTAFDLDPSPANNSSSLPTTIIGISDIGLGMTASPDPVIAGNNVTFTLWVTNRGPSSATGIMLTNPFPAGATFVSSTTPSGTTNLSGGGIGFNLGTVASNMTVAATVTLRASGATGTILNSASVTNMAAADPVPGDNVASDSVSVTANADLQVTQNVNPTSMFVSSNTTITLVVSNRGPNAATNAVLSDTVPPGLAVLSAQWNQGPCQVEGGVVTCNMGTLAPNSSATATIVVRGVLDGSWTNSPSVSSSAPDVNNGNNSVSATITVNDNPNVPLLKIIRSGNNVVLSWSTNATRLGFVLQAKTNLSPNSSWANVTNVPVTVGRQSMVTNSLSGGQYKYYRLFKPNQMLSINRVGSSVVLSWPAVSATAVLRKTSNLTPVPVWTNVPGSPTLVSNRYFVTNPISGGRGYYRLYN